MTVEFRPSADDVSAAADSYSLNLNAEHAKRRLQKLSKAEQETIINQLIRDRTARNLPLEADRLVALGRALGVNVSGTGTVVPPTTPAPGTPVPTPVSTQPGGFDPLLPLLGILAVLILASIAGFVFFTRIFPNLRKPRPTRIATPSISTPTPAAAGGDLRYGAAPAPTTTAGGMGRFVPQYMLGNDNYDTSYSLETSRGEFMGECGMGISETIGEGKPDKVTAFDLWLFDKADVRTVTQILMSDFAYKDQTLRTKLATKGEAVLAERGKTVHLETHSLSIDAHIVELVYANNPSFPPNSHFQKLVVEIVPTVKEGAAVR